MEKTSQRKIIAATSLITATLLILEIIIFAVYPLPANTAEIYNLLLDNPTIGLIDLYLLEFIAYIFWIPMFIAIQSLLGDTYQSRFALTFTLIGIAVFLSTNNPFTMLNLSKLYAPISSDYGRNKIIMMGDFWLINTGQRAHGGFNTGLLLLSLGGLLFSYQMYKSKSYNKITAFSGLVSFSLSILDFFRVVIIPYQVIVLVILAILSGLSWIVWLFSLAGNMIIEPQSTIQK